MPHSHVSMHVRSMTKLAFISDWLLSQALAAPSATEPEAVIRADPSSTPTHRSAYSCCTTSTPGSMVVAPTLRARYCAWIAKGLNHQVHCIATTCASANSNHMISAADMAHGALMISNCSQHHLDNAARWTALHGIGCTRAYCNHT